MPASFDTIRETIQHMEADVLVRVVYDSFAYVNTIARITRNNKAKLLIPCL